MESKIQVPFIILKVIFGVGKLSSALASKFCPRPRPRPRRFVLGLGLGLGDLSSASASRICPRLTSLICNEEEARVTRDEEQVLYVD